MSTPCKVVISRGSASDKGGVGHRQELSFDGFATWLTSAKPALGELLLVEYLKTRQSAKDDSAPDHKAAKAICDVEKEKVGWWYCVADFKGNRRNADDFVSAGVATLDFDQGTLTQQIIRTALKGLRYVAIPTYSYSPAAQMWRVHVALSEPTTSREQHEAVVSAIWRRFGEKHPIDPRSFLPEQFYWGPSCPPDAVQHREAINE